MSYEEVRLNQSSVYCWLKQLSMIFNQHCNVKKLGEFLADFALCLKVIFDTVSYTSSEIS